MARFPERDPENYVWKFFYCNKKDPRIMVPKRNPNWGMTVNFAQRRTYLFLLLAFGFFAFVLSMMVINNP